MILHDYILIGIILIVIALQVIVVVKTVIKIKGFKSIFKSGTSYSTVNVFLTDSQIKKCSIDKISNIISTSDNLRDSVYLEGKEYGNDDELLPVSLIKASTLYNPISTTILDSINMYLLKNTGSASDFNLIKNIVDRNCESEEEVINVQQPIPLYLGLVGTMIGIIIGVGSLAFSDVFQNLEEFDTSAIGYLMKGVALAMIASFLGIAFTTFLSWYFKEAKSESERNKNTFFSWVQAELIPVISSNVGNSLFLLQQNLAVFNKKFSDNVLKMDKSLSQVTDSYSQQIELITLIERLDVQKMSQANIIVLKTLNESVDKIDRFNTYLTTINGYVGKVDTLTEGLNEHLERTAMIEKMGEFFQAEIEQVDARKIAISTSVTDIDNNLKKVLDELKNSSESSMRALINSSTDHQEKLKKTLKEQEEELRTRLQSAIDDQATLLKEKLKEADAFLTELSKVSEMGDSMLKMVQQTENQNNKLDLVLSALYNLAGVMKESNIQRLSQTTSGEQIFTPVPQSLTVGSLFAKIALGIVAVALVVIVVLQSITFYLNLNV